MLLHIYHNSHDLFYREPFGAVPSQSQIKLRLTIQSSEPISQCQLRVWEKGREERYLTMEQEPGLGETQQTTFGVEYQVPQEPGLVWYYFQLKIGEQIFYYGNNQEMLGGEGALSTQQPPGYQITVFLPNQVPRWYKEGIMYQIFVDRFHRHWDQEEGEKIMPPVKRKGLLHLDWYDTPFYIRDEQGRIDRWPFFGGNLAGIIKKLDYLQELGVTILYLNPIFEASSNHKYDTGDYHTIDPMFGDEEIFRELVTQGRKRGINIILDGVFSHTGADSIYFNKEGNYPSVGAFQSPTSPYYDWYIFKDYPHDYESWWGVDVLPNVNEMVPSYRQFIYGGEDSVVRHWLKAGAKGWRLDVADELPDQFIKELRQALKETDPEAVLLGEVWEDASNKISYDVQREYLWGEELDSTMNYPLREIWLDFVLGQEGAPRAHHRIMSLYENYPRENFYGAMNLIGSHDRIRALTLLGEAPPAENLTEREKEEFRLTADQRELGKRRLKLLVLLQMTFPGVPCIYYGDEAGLEGYADPYNRGTFPWGKEDQELMAWHRKMVWLRKEYHVLITGDFQSFFQGEDIYGFLREGEEEGILVVVNRHPREKRTVDLSPWLPEPENNPPLDLLAGTVLPLSAGEGLTLSPLEAKVIYLKKKEYIKGRRRPLSRAAGILLHISSLPSPWGIGDLGSEAYEFVDFLQAAGQRIWQILPTNPLGAGDSPYHSPSAFAGNELLIDLEALADKGLLPAKTIRETRAKMAGEEDEPRIDFTRVKVIKGRLLRQAFNNFCGQDASFEKDYQTFRQAHGHWLADYSLFMALKKELGDISWHDWHKLDSGQPIASREPGTLAYYREKLKKEIEYHQFVQYLFYTQWQELKDYANSKGIKILGDLPIYVAPDSVDTWANPHLFHLDQEGKPSQVAGVPPDYFSETGQLWGNPLYCWEAMAEEDYSWWVARIKHSFQLVDYLRLDHFRGFEAYWEIPAQATSATAGRWRKGPGKRFFAHLFQELGELPLIAEDLGFLTPEVDNLKNIFQLPGMKVFQFTPEEILSIEDENWIFYTGTHDNNTLVGWLPSRLEEIDLLLENNSQENREPSQRKRQGKLVEDYRREIITRLYQSKGRWVILPLQDVLGLGEEARMNIPGTPVGNWGWRWQQGQITPEVITWLRELVRESKRGN